MTISLSVRVERWALKAPFVMSSERFDRSDCIVVELHDGDHIGRGEAAGVNYHAETAETMAASVEAIRPAIEAGADRATIARLMPPGGARNAVDCALWSLEAKRSGVRIEVMAGLPNLPFATATTISLGLPEAMVEAARSKAAFGLLKVKIGADSPVERIVAIRAARPDARIIVDVNGGWTIKQLRGFAPALADLGVEMIEQPLAPGADRDLMPGDSPVLLCADESCPSGDDLSTLPAGYGAVCIKLDKTGGLTEAIALADAAERRGLTLMISNMIGTSLAMAPAALLVPRCRFVDLDGPLLLLQDRDPPMVITGDVVQPFPEPCWG